MIQIGRKPLPPHLVKKRVSFSLPQWLAKDIEKLSNKSAVVEKLLIQYMKDLSKNRE